MAKNIILSNLCSAIRNGQKARKLEINISNNNKNLGIIKVLKREGFIRGYSEENSVILVFLKYYHDKPVISKIEPFLDNNNLKNITKKKLEQQRAGLETYILSTSKGIFSNFESINLNEGGQLLIKIL
jgi:small subunit ribosomal protein S8